jgi:hypothetical protein
MEWLLYYEIRELFFEPCHAMPSQKEMLKEKTSSSPRLETGERNKKFLF